MTHMGIDGLDKMIFFLRVNWLQDKNSDCIREYMLKLSFFFFRTSIDNFLILRTAMSEVHQDWTFRLDSLLEGSRGGVIVDRGKQF